MPLLTEAQVMEHIETDLAPAAITRLIDDADEAIVSRFGPHASAGAVTETIRGGVPLLFPSRRIGTVTSVTEINGTTETVLLATDYELLHGGRELRRLATGSTWGERVRLVYTPYNDDAVRNRVELDLVRLAITYGGSAKQESIGDYSSSASLTPEGYQAEREMILSELAPAWSFA